MTLIVGIKCEEGIVIAADSRVTLGVVTPTAGQDTTKLEIIENNVIVGISGHVGLGQKLLLSMEGNWTKVTGSKTSPIEARNIIRNKMWAQIEPEMKTAAISKVLFGEQAVGSAVCHTLIALPLQGKIPTLLVYDQ